MRRFPAIIKFPLLVAALTIVSCQAAGRPAPTGYVLTLAPGLSTNTSPAEAARVAVRYLDEQTLEIAAPNLHQEPVVHSVAAVLARDARQLEPGTPRIAIDENPTRIVWVVAVGGDFLNLHDLAWSRRGDPYPDGNVVIDDATGKILGVYPGSPRDEPTGVPPSLNN